MANCSKEYTGFFSDSIMTENINDQKTPSIPITKINKWKKNKSGESVIRSWDTMVADIDSYTDTESYTNTDSLCKTNLLTETLKLNPYQKYEHVDKPYINPRVQSTVAHKQSISPSSNKPNVNINLPKQSVSSISYYRKPISIPIPIFTDLSYRQQNRQQYRQQDRQQDRPKMYIDNTKQSISPHNRYPSPHNRYSSPHNFQKSYSPHDQSISPYSPCGHNSYSPYGHSPYSPYSPYSPSDTDLKHKFKPYDPVSNCRSAGVIPYTIHNGKILFLFQLPVDPIKKKDEGLNDFGGKRIEDIETTAKIAAREFSEETSCLFYLKEKEQSDIQMVKYYNLLKENKKLYYNNNTISILKDLIIDSQKYYTDKITEYISPIYVSSKETYISYFVKVQYIPAEEIPRAEDIHVPYDVRYIRKCRWYSITEIMEMSEKDFHKRLQITKIQQRIQDYWNKKLFV